MKKIKIFFFAMAAVLVFTGCEKSVFKQFDNDFSESRWQKSDVRHYEFDLPSGDNYDLMVNFSTIYGAQFAAIPIKITIETPDGNTSIEDVVLRLADENGKDLADCTGDYCDLEQVVFANKRMEAGHYKVSVANEFDHEFLPNVLGIGIRVVSAKK